MGVIKLSPAQLTLLKERSGSFIDSYKPGQRLKALGLIDCEGGSYNVQWRINAAGEAYLASLERVDGGDAFPDSPPSVPADLDGKSDRLGKQALREQWKRIANSTNPEEAFEAEVRSLLGVIVPASVELARLTERERCLGVVRAAAEHWELDSPPGSSPTKREARAARLLEKAITAKAAGMPAVLGAIYYDKAERLMVTVIGVDEANVYYSGDANGFAPLQVFETSFVLQGIGVAENH
ncbi:hypothetical protein [Ralstonia pseudosolanacearum]|uniref:hypothetical protein n=1 Tax=Ralstonia pseudosolanacearum TaxID=1310165 RepID=UPI003CF9B12A